MSASTESNVIAVGQPTGSRFVAFGDESKYGDLLVYAMVYVEHRNVARITEQLGAIKSKYRLPLSRPLHCYAMFDKHQRKKKQMEHLDIGAARHIVSLVTTILVRNHAFVRAGVGRLPDIENRLGGALVLTSSVDGSTKEFPVSGDYKAYFPTLMLACTFDLPGSPFPRLVDTELLVAEESTKVRYFGANRRADRLFNNFSDIGAPSGQVFQLNPTVVPADGNPLMELADVAAYLVSHGMDDKEWNAAFRVQLQRLGPRLRIGEIPLMPMDEKNSPMSLVDSDPHQEIDREFSGALR